MPASITRPRQAAAPLGQLWWLPSSGTGNGLEDSSGVLIADVRTDAAGPLLAALRADGIPGYAAELSRRRRRGDPSMPRQRIWVGASAYGRAEQLLLRLLPSLPGGAANDRG